MVAMVNIGTVYGCYGKRNNCIWLLWLTQELLMVSMVNIGTVYGCYSSHKN